MMAIFYKLILFVLASCGIVWVSRAALRDVRVHGFYRFFAWEAILILFLLNVDYWFVNPFGARQIVAWLFLIVSLILIVQGVRLFRKRGKPDPNRADPVLVGIEKTTELVTTGLYRYIRHPFYSSLLFLAWGIFLKHLSWVGCLLVIVTAVLLFITARREEAENTDYFGEPYRAYMKRTKMFVPFIF